MSNANNWRELFLDNPFERVIQSTENIGRLYCHLGLMCDGVVRHRSVDRLLTERYYWLGQFVPDDDQPSIIKICLGTITISESEPTIFESFKLEVDMADNPPHFVSLKYKGEHPSDLPDEDKLRGMAVEVSLIEERLQHLADLNAKAS